MQGNLHLLRFERRERPARRLEGLTSYLVLVETWLGRRRQRRNLRELSDHLLKDIGITRSEAYLEGRKRFWQA